MPIPTMVLVWVMAMLGRCVSSGEIARPPGDSEEREITRTNAVLERPPPASPIQ
jgi:hypothetical protein